MSKWERTLTWVLQIAVLCYVLYAEFNVGRLKDEQISLNRERTKTCQQNLEKLRDQNSYWEKRSKILKSNIELMKKYVEKMKMAKDEIVDKLNQSEIRNESLKSISEFDKYYDKFDNLYRKSIPLCYRVE